MTLALVPWLSAQSLQNDDDGAALRHAGAIQMGAIRLT
jgi:hypothetical protein